MKRRWRVSKHNLVFSQKQTFYLPKKLTLPDYVKALRKELFQTRAYDPTISPYLAYADSLQATNISLGLDLFYVIDLVMNDLRFDFSKVNKTFLFLLSPSGHQHLHPRGDLRPEAGLDQ